MKHKYEVVDKNGTYLFYDPATGIITTYDKDYEYNKQETKYYEYIISVNVNDLDSFNEEICETISNTRKNKILHSAFKGEISVSYITSDLKDITPKIKNKMYKYILKEINEIENNIKKIKKEKNILKYLRKQKLKNINNDSSKKKIS